MRNKPRGRKYRNLYARNEVIWIEKLVHGRRIRRSCKTDDWDVAAAVRDEYERLTGASRLPGLTVSKFADLADRYLEWMNHLAPTTQDDRRSLLRNASSERPEGALRAYFGRLPVDEIRKPLLLEWWAAEVEGRGRAAKTGRNYLDALSGVLALAVDSEVLEANPVDGFRAILRRRNRTQKGRAQSDPTASICPIEDPTELDAFVAESRKVGGAAHIVDLLCFDAGLRLGEATALRWEDCSFGRDASDTTRSLRIRASRSRGLYLGKTKSGRERSVAMSRRLRGALLAYQLEQGRPEAGAIAPVDHGNYRSRHFRTLCKAAKISQAVRSDGTERFRTPKDLRDTFASQLLTAGVQLGYVSRQLGHSDVSVTARHYARWAGGDAYRSPLDVRKDEVPADLLARLAEKSPQSPHTAAKD
jgi:integrase